MSRMKKFGDIVKEENRLITVLDDIEYRCGGVRLYGKGIFIREYKHGIEIKKKFVQHVLNAGDIVYSTLFAKSGAFAVADADMAGAVLSEKFPTFRLIDNNISLDYLRWFFRSGQMNRIAEEQVTGIAAFSLSHLSKSKFLNLLVPVPPSDRQAEVVRLCEEISKHANATSSPLENNIVLARHLIAACAASLFNKHNLVQLSKIGSYVMRAAEIIPDQQYTQVTVAMNHKGLRVRRVCDGSEIKSSGQCYVREGDILFSRIDIRQGAIGFVGKDLDGAVVTRDFPVFRLNNSTDLARRYLRYVFLSPSFMLQARNASRGTTGRKKLKRDRFLEFLVPWPSNDEQAAAVSMLDEIEKRASATVSTSRSQEILVQKLVASAIGQLFLTDSGLAGRGSRPSAE
jgi:restriction endonuclease S subunit